MTNIALRTLMKLWGLSIFTLIIILVYGFVTILRGIESNGKS